MNCKRLFVLFPLILAALEAPAAGVRAQQDAAEDARSERKGTWSARNRAGRTLGGTWTAVADPKTGAVTGTWTLNDANGRTVGRGAWSAAKSPKEWTGAWRARAAGSDVEYSGTWRASVDLKPNARFADLFELGAKTIVSGEWRAGAHSGAWSIRASD